MSNRLGSESSPYLLQHQENPVDWYPWGVEALERAKRENKPILLSVGYSACHWCHVMAHESFENPEIASLMNANFINIKVDREERPDLDQIYQNVAQVMTRGGGWPLTVFLTPDLKPFFGGTYFPPEDRWGRPGFPRVLQALAQAYRDEPENVGENARKLAEIIGQLEDSHASASGESLEISDELLTSWAERLLGIFDWEHGGLTGAPKFPNTMLLQYLWRVGMDLDSSRAREVVVLTLEKMARGGIYDQLGGGFARYSVDEVWLVPHFEKMLYDNGLLLKLYSEVVIADHALQGTLLEAATRRHFIQVIEETAQCLLRDFRSPDGGFYSAWDADSEGEEGKFYVWSEQELRNLLTDREFQAVSRYYGVRDSGNFEHGNNILNIARDPSEVAEEMGVEEDDLHSILRSARRKLFERRETRVRPGLDDKRLVAWNALTISGLIFAARALQLSGTLVGELEKECLEAARRAFDIILSSAEREPGRLNSIVEGDGSRLNGYLDDYSFLAMAALDLARMETNPESATGQVNVAARLLSSVITFFADSENAGYFFTSSDHESLIQRPKSIHDQAIPNGTSLAISGMLALSELDPDVERRSRWIIESEKQIHAFLVEADRVPQAMGEFLCAVLLKHRGAWALSARLERPVFIHPHLFSRATTEASTLCHRQTCSGIPVDPASLEQHLRDQLFGR